MAMTRKPGSYDYLADREPFSADVPDDLNSDSITDPTMIIGGNIFKQYAMALRRLAMGQKSPEQLQREQAEALESSRLSDAPKPYDSNFSLDKYDTDPEYAKNREMDDEDREASRKFAGQEEEAGPEISGRRYQSRPASGTKIREIGPIAVGTKQAEYFSVLPSVAAATGVPVAMIGAMWGNESRFSTLGNSPSGCVGAGQFCSGTWASMIKQYGDKIPGMEGYAAGLRNKTIRDDDAGLQAMRNDQKASAYASGFYLAEIARGLKVDPAKQESWGVMYAGYVVGPENARQMMKAAAANDDRPAAGMFPKAAGWNPMFFNGGQASSTQALGTFQSTINTTSRAFDQQIVAKFDPGRTIYAGASTPTLVAKNPDIKVADPLAGTIYARADNKSVPLVAPMPS